MKLKGACFHEGHDDELSIHFPDHHTDDVDGAGAADEIADSIWALDNVELTTVGVDVGSSTSHLLFAKLHLQRLTQSLSSRYAVVHREVLHRSPILLTPYRPDGLIDVDALDAFVMGSYEGAGLRPDEIDTGAVILTGAALERANARAVADLFAGEGGKFVCASAGHNLEALLAANGSGAVALSHTRGDVVLHMDIGGGTSKLAVLRDGEVLETAAVQVGGRLVAVDDDERLTRIEIPAEIVARELGITLRLGERLSEVDRRRLASRLVDVLLEVASGSTLGSLAQELMLTPALHTLDELRPAAVTFSGGVSEYVYRRESTSYGDLAMFLADALGDARDQGRLPAPVTGLGEGIRATVIGASQFSVQLSGNTVHISDASVLPLRNLPVAYARIPQGEVTEESVAAAINRAVERLDLREGETPVALALPWSGEPFYATLRAMAGGIARAMPNAIAASFPLVIALEGDVGRSLGAILQEECGVTTSLVAIDGLNLMELDFVDVGELIQPANVVPVVVKSLAFPEPKHAAGTSPNGSAVVAQRV